MTQIKSLDSESHVHEMIASLLRYRYPGVIFHTDFGAGIKLPIWIAKRQKKLQYKRGFPDIIILQPVILNGQVKHGLAIEVKKLGVRLKKMNGEWVNDHFREQYEMLKELNAQGYEAVFACGYDEAKIILEWYFAEEPLELEFEDFILKSHNKPGPGPDSEEF